MQQDEVATPPQPRARASIIKRLLLGFVIVSLIPILVLAALSLREAADEGSENPAGGELAGSDRGERADAASGARVLGG